jgi:hypothetical protein
MLYPREMLNELLDKSGPHAPGARETLVALVDTVFFASLKREESEPVQVAVVHDEKGAPGLSVVLDTSPEASGNETPEPAWDVVEIEPRPFDPRTLAKLSRGLRYGTHLAIVGGRAPDLRIEGIARRHRRSNGGPVTRIAAPRPGVLVFEEEDRELLRFDAGERGTPPIDVLGEDGPVRAAVATSAGEVQGTEHGYSSTEWALTSLIREMRATGSGAILAVSPAAPTESVMSAIRYRRRHPTILGDRIRDDRKKRLAWLSALVAVAEGEPTVNQLTNRDAKRAERDRAREDLDAAIDDVAQLSSIDGAVLAGPGMAIYGGGYLVPLVSKLECIAAEDAQMTKTAPWSPHHGARHQAGLSFAYSNPGGVSFVVSEDGPISCATRIGDKVVVWPVRVSET